MDNQFELAETSPKTLHVYLNLASETLALRRHLEGMREPLTEYHKSWNDACAGKDYAQEWLFPAGEFVLPKLQKLVSWQTVFDERGKCRISTNSALKEANKAD